MKMVHGNGKRLMRFLRDRTIGHGSGFKALYDGFFTFDFRQIDPFRRISKIQQAPQISRLLVIDHPGVCFIFFVTSIPDRFLQHMDRLRVVPVVLSLASCFVPSSCRQFQIRGQSQWIKSPAVLFVTGFFDVLQSDAANTAHRSRKISLDHILRDTDRFEYLASLIRLDRGDPHLGSDLYDAEQDRFIVILHSCVIILVQQFFCRKLRDRGMSQVGIDRRGSIPQKGCEMMYLPGFAGFQDQGHCGAFSGIHQMLMNGCHCQQGRDRHMVLVYAAVRQDQDIGSLAVGFVHFHEKMLKDSFHRGTFVKQCGDLCHMKTFLVHILDLQKIQVGKDRIIDLQHMAVFRLFFQQISVLSYIDSPGSHDLLPLCIDRRIGHLGKKLLEIIKQRLICFRKGCDRGIHAHGTDLLRTGQCHR